jgi:hypothetical protein
MSKQQNNKRRHAKSYRKVIIFFSRKRTKEVMTFLLFVCLSACFWVMQTVYEETDGSFEVQLVVRDMPNNAVFTTAIPTTLKVTVHDKSIVLLHYYYKSALKALEVDFERYADEAGNFRLSGTELHALLQSKLDGTTQISTVTPAIIDARFALAHGRKLPVRFVGDCVAQLQSRCSEPRLTPDSVLVYAPDAIIDTLHYVSTECRNYRDLSASVDETLPLQVPIGVKTQPEEVRLQIHVEEYVEKTFQRVPIETLLVPDSLQLRIFPSMAHLSCNVDLSKYKTLKEEDFMLTVSYEDIMAGGTPQKRLPIRVARHPEAATHIHLRPDSVEYIIEENYSK